MQPKVIATHGIQQYRTVWASAEILASTFVVNAVTLGSFLRDKGAKKNKYKRSYSVSDSVDRASARRTTLATLYQFDSDDDDDDAALFYSMGYGVPAHLRTKRHPRPAPPAVAARDGLGIVREASEEYEMDTRETGDSIESDDSFETHKCPNPQPGDAPTTQSLNLFDVGHLLEGNEQRDPGRPLSRATTVESGCAEVSAQDFASSAHADYGSRAFLRDAGGMLNTTFVNELRNSALSPRRRHETQMKSESRHRPGTAPIGILGPMLERRETEISLQDAGGLLHPTTHSTPVNAGWQSTQRPETYSAEEGRSSLDDNRHPDRSELALQPISRRSSDEEHAASMPTPLTGGPDDMVLHDPGGLARP